METWLGLKYLAISVLFPPSIFFLIRNLEEAVVSDTWIPPGLLQAHCFWQHSSANLRIPKAHFIPPAGAELSFVVPQQPGMALLSCETTSSCSDHKKGKRRDYKQKDAVVCQRSPAAFPQAASVPVTHWQDAMERFLYKEILEAAPSLELKATSPIAAAPKAKAPCFWGSPDTPEPG